ncbi:MAG TPA: hypothetical protein VHO95_00840 [Candidatus Dormibacteraeota bacterium]|nr:hypothetical protein [Candidatus Dormibacteraeota bacterium]
MKLTWYGAGQPSRLRSSTVETVSPRLGGEGRHRAIERGHRAGAAAEDEILSFLARDEAAIWFDGEPGSHFVIGRQADEI